MAKTSMNWAQIEADPRFQETVPQENRLPLGLMVFSVIYYFLLPIGAAYFQTLFKQKVWGPVNVGILFAMSEFVVAWLIAFIYSHKANAEFDAMTQQIIAHFPARGNDMNQNMKTFSAACAALLLTASSAPVLAASGAVDDKYKWMTFAVFGVIIGITMYITYWAAKHTHTTSEFYAAGRTVSGLQNGWAIAGDYLSAASFLA